MAEIPGDVFADDDSIPDDARLLRRIPPGHVAKNTPTRRPQSDCFKNSPDGSGISVAVWEEEEQPENLLSDTPTPGYGIGWITAGDVREQGLGVVPDPIDTDPHHALIQGMRKSHNKIRRKLAEAFQWFRRPDPE